MKAQKPQRTAPKIVVEAAGTAVSAKDPDLARKLSEAQVKAVEQAIKDGVSVSDGAAMREIKRKAREAVLNAK